MPPHPRIMLSIWTNGSAGKPIASTGISIRSAGSCSWSRRSSASSASGSSNQKVLPRPTALSSPMRPPMSSTSCLAIVVPRPVPPNRRVWVWSAWVKLSKMRRWSWGAMPIPVSRIENFSVTASGPPSTRETWSVTPPRSVNLTAFASRLMRTWRRCASSPRATDGTSGMTIETKLSSFASACGRSICITPLTSA